ncbi:hypothetical protein LPJ68_005445 [Coemansia sp. RSA 1086]|nr:hypothetical protein LPJ68_005445 [Coemansia sp. RSA 1086]
MFIGTTILLSSGVLAGIRRATGLTLKRTNWPPVDRKTSQKWLTWYHTRLTQLNERAEQRVQSAISRYSADIPDPNVRQVWEDQLRKDVAEKIRRIEDRIKYFQHMVDCKQRYPWGLAVYLKMGEWLVDCLVGWMRNSKHFVVDPLVDHREDVDIWHEHKDPIPFIAQPAMSAMPAMPSTPSMPQPSAPPLPEPDKLPEASTSQYNEPPPYTLEDEKSI